MDFKKPNESVLTDFPFVSQKDVLQMMDISKFYLYKLQSRGIIKRYYLEKDSEGKPKGKPYYNKKEIADTLKLIQQ